MDNQQLVLALYEFVTCQRPDGTFYGNGGGKCHKGDESSLPEKEKRVPPPFAMALNKYSEELRRVYGEIDLGGAEEAHRFYEGELGKYREKIEKGELTLEDLEKHLVSNLNFPKETEVVVVGLEPGSGYRGSPEELAIHIAEHQTFERYGKVGEMAFTMARVPNDPNEMSLSKENAKNEAYSNKMGRIVNTLVSSPYEGEIGLSAMRREGVWGNNLSVIKAAGTSEKQWRESWGEILLNQKDKRLQERFGKRSDYYKKYGDFRSKALLKSIKSSFDSGNLKYVISFPGKGNSEGVDSLIRSHKKSGGKVFSHSEKISDHPKAPKVDIKVLEISKGKYMTIYGAHPTGHYFPVDGARNSVLRTIELASAGKLEEI